jgi:hypothetical protein
VAWFEQADLARMRPADQVAVRARGQGWRPPGLAAEVSVLNIGAAAFAALPLAISEDGSGITAGVRMVLPSKVAGNGIGRPAAGWDLDLQLTAAPGDASLLLGDLVAISDIDARFNMGFRRGWLTVGLLVHGASPLPGHGPGLTPVLTGPATALRAEPDAAGHAGLTEALVQLLTVEKLPLQ